MKPPALPCLVALVLLPSVADAFGVGCGIYVREHSDGGEQIFFAKHDDTIVLMRIGEDLVTLTAVSAESQGRLRDFGDVMRRVYVAGATRVEARFEVTRVCAVGARECDGVGVSAVFRVLTAGAIEEITGAGGSGC